MRRQLALLWLVLGLACVGPAQAATHTMTVTTTSDVDQNGTGACATGGSCSLREAVNQANLDSGDTITLPNLGSAYVLNTSFGQLSFSADATLNGAGASSVAISGSNATRLLTVASPASVTVSGVTLELGSGGPNPGGAASVSQERR